MGFTATISTHTSRVGCDSAGIPLGSPGYIFLLTHPVWDVTGANIMADIDVVFLLTHPVWDVTIMDRLSLLVKANFYSHIPCGM